ncbi:MAG: efflux RND transporter periplasmic adaptor subunit [Planctomycetota bacterium]|nr:efflux RND transporter periplasmic adaptor subunit [Planctomycetota bacterium]
MKRVLMILVLVAVTASAGIIGYISGREGGAGEGEEKEKEAQKVAAVKTAAAHMTAMGRTIVAYGVVRASPEGVHIFSVPFETRVRRLLVTPGQAVAEGTALLEVDPSPGTILQVQQARSSVDSATRKLAQARQAAAIGLQEARGARETAAKILVQTQRRLEMRLATGQEVLQAQQEMQSAQLKLEGLEKQEATPEVLQAQQDLQAAKLQMESLDKLGIGNAQLKCETAGVVSNLIAQEGQIVPAGGPLVELAEEKRIEVRLGVEPSDAADLKADHPVRVRAVNDSESKPVEGRIRMITRRVNPASRLVDVFVALPAEARLILETYVRGEAVADSRQALAVPRSAVLPDEDKHVVYTIKDGKAVRHEVKTGLEDAEQVEVLGDALKPGEMVVVEGNYELEDGMAVKVETEPAEKEPKASGAPKEKAQ